MLTYKDRTRPTPKISIPNYTETGDSHNPTSSQSHRPIIPSPSRPNGDRTGKLRVRVYPQVGSINNGTDINACCMQSNLLRKLGAEWANGRDAHKKLHGYGASLPFFFLPSSLLLFLLPLFPHLFLATAKKYGEALKPLSGSGWSLATKRNLVNFGLKDCFRWGQF